MSKSAKHSIKPANNYYDNIFLSNADAYDTAKILSSLPQNVIDDTLKKMAREAGNDITLQRFVLRVKNYLALKSTK